MNQSIRQHLSVLESLHEGGALIGAGSHRLCTALPEQTGHGRLICQAETSTVLKKGKDTSS